MSTQRWTCAAIVAVLSVRSPMAADQPLEVKTTLARAVEALGGQQKLKQFKGETWSEKGDYFGLMDTRSYKGNYWSDHQRRFRMEAEGLFVVVVNGDRGWIKLEQRQTKDMKASEVKAYQQVIYLGLVRSLVELTKEEYRLSKLPDGKVVERPTIGIKVEHAGFPDLRLDFDKQTALLLKSQYRGTSHIDGRLVDLVTEYRDYKEVNGLRYPSRLTRWQDGKVLQRAEIIDWMQAERLDDPLFDKP